MSFYFCRENYTELYEYRSLKSSKIARSPPIKFQLPDIPSTFILPTIRRPRNTIASQNNPSNTIGEPTARTETTKREPQSLSLSQMKQNKQEINGELNKISENSVPGDVTVQQAHSLEFSFAAVSQFAS